MLYLDRRVNEAVMIGDDICVRVLRVRGQQVRLGFIAPKHVTVHRLEVYERLDETRALPRDGNPQA